MLKRYQDENQRNYKRKYSTSKNREKFRVLRKARNYLRSGDLSKSSYDLFILHMNSNE